MKKKPILQRIGDFLEGKGFYIVLLLCVAAVGASGYYLFSGMNFGKNAAPVAGQAVVEISPTASPKVTITPTPKPIPTPTPTPKPTATPAATPTPSPKVKNSVYTWPVKGEVLSEFSLEVLAYDTTMGDWRTHSGMDVAADLGTEVLAASDGTVTDVFVDDLMGTTVVIKHSDGCTSTYCNLAATPTVKVGDKVTTGAVIGSVGSTAIAESSLAPHLHFEMSVKGESVDPMSYLPKR
ncbi:hypothetical protein SDC9_64276 [bioreactor metagenome]|uniref:M23ase beta-sheet core domain-containing protein n=1 Tax=bioreactor metagenome TaxID=1076179 RepID=A0A644XNV4_9ZZZZ